MSEILLDPITEFNKQKKLAEDAKNAEIKRTIDDEKKFKLWCKDSQRVSAFNKKFTLENRTHNHEVIVEVFMTYPEAVSNKIIFETMTGLTASQESELLLFPFVKDLNTGKVYAVSAYFAEYHYNEEAIAQWQEIRAEKPSFTVPRPPEYYWGYDRSFGNKRFDLNPFQKNMTPQRFYTYMIPSIILGPEVKV